MSETVGEAVLRLRVDPAGADFDREGKRAGKVYSTGFGSSLKGLAATAAGFLAVDKAIGFAKDAVAEQRESQKEGAKTTAVIKATGGAANVSAKQVGDLANSISAKTGVDDEAIQSGENLLLTFNKVRNEAGKGNDVFNRATKAASDLAAAGFGSLTGNSVQLGKALQDPVKGITALARSGVSFDESTKAQIKSLVAQNKTLDAQKIILSAVEGQVGGVAEATATSGEKAKVAYKNIQESIGGVLTPAIDKASDLFANHLAPSIQAGIGDLPKVGAAVGRARDVVVGAVDTIRARLSQGKGGGVLGALTDGVKTAVPVVVGFVQGQLLPAVQRLGKQAVPVLQTMAATFTDDVLPAVRSVVAYVSRSLAPIFVTVFGIVTRQLIPAFLQVAKFIYGQVYPAVIAIATAVARNLKPVFDAFVQVIQRDILPTVQRLIVQFRTQLFPALQPIIAAVIKVAGFFLRLAAAILGRVLPPLIRLAGFIFARVVPALVSIITFVARVIGGVIRLAGAFGRGTAAIFRFARQLGEGVGRGIRNVIDGIASLPGRIAGLAKNMAGAGKSLIQGLVHGIANAGGFVKDFAGNVWKVVKRLINGAIDRINSALEFTVDLPLGKSITINPKNIPHLARGTSNFAGGLAVVGERGPELTALPRGSQVFTARQTAALGGGITIGTLVAHDYQDFERQIDRRQALSAVGGRRFSR